MELSADRFWDIQHEETRTAGLSPAVQRAVSDALAYFGDVRGKRILDIGCGNGGTSLMLARGGGEVLALDTSQVAVDNLNTLAREQGIRNVIAVRADAMQIGELGGFDYVFGSLILHHIEPFDEFASLLGQSIRRGGRAFFFENNAASDLLIWFREHIVGRLWVPRCGDGIEFPLTPAEIDMLRRHFSVEIRVPEMVFFQLASTYLLKRRLQGVTRAIDAQLFRWNLGRKYSYRQYVMLQN